MFELATEVVLWLMLAAFVAGAVDAIAGGGGLIIVPALLLAGISPLQTLATSKLQSSFGAGTAALTYARAGHVHLREQWPMALVSILAAAGGAMVAHLIPVEALRIVMPVVLIAVAAFFAFRKGLSDLDRAQRLKPAVFMFTAVPLIAAYDGFFGPGTGSFFMMAFVLLAGFGVLKATAHTKVLNFASNIGALLVFIPSGAILWKVGLAMALGQTFGALLGARLAIRIGARVIRPLLVVTSTVMALRLLWQLWSS